jgi:prepilin-type N-terminal cleavage/methylation domain-containing protein
MEKYCTQRKAAFTLLELMVVMGVMALLFGLIGFSLRGSGTEIKSLQRELVSMIVKIRNLAISEGTEVRLAVRTDFKSKDHFSRYLEIHSEGNMSDLWVVRESDYFLPDGTWFVPDPMNSLDNFKFPEKWFSDAGSVWSGIVEVGMIEGAEDMGKQVSLRKESAGGGVEFSYIAFDSSGRLVSGGSSPKLVFSAGEIKPQPDGFHVQVDDEYDIAGILIQKLGGIIPLSSNDFDYD